jgi:hypothetical protein
MAKKSGAHSAAAAPSKRSMPTLMKLLIETLRREARPMSINELSDRRSRLS